MGAPFKDTVAFHISLCLLVKSPEEDSSWEEWGGAGRSCPPLDVTPQPSQATCWQGEGPPTLLWVGLQGWKWSRGAGETEGDYKVPTNSRCDDRLLHINTGSHNPRMTSAKAM